MSELSLVTSAEEAALAGYYRFWLLVDGPLENAIAQDDGLTGLTACRIANAYSVARTFAGSEARKWDVVAQHIHQLSEKWSSDRQFNAAQCIVTAMDLKNELGGKPPYSGTTKLIWFLQPDGWTVYDRFAAEALIPSGGHGRRRVTDFYQELGQRFDEISQMIGSQITEVEPRLRPERIVDQMLVLRGMPRAMREARLQDIENWLLCLPTAMRAQILAATHTIAPKLKAALPNRFVSKPVKKVVT